MTAPLVIVGGGGHARVVAGILQRIGRWRIIGYTDRENRGELLLGLPYLGTDDALKSLRDSGSVTTAAIGVGHLGDAAARVGLFDRLGALGLKLPAIIDPSAVVAQETSVGDATVVMPGAVINVGARVGAVCIINSHATVEHDSSIGAHTHVAPGAIICGGCHVGEASMIGAGAVLAHGVRVAGRCLIGAGATVVSDISEPGIYVGTPARKLR